MKDSTLKLINDVSKLFRNDVRIESDKMGMIGSYWPILMHLSHQDGLTQLELVQLTLMTPPSTSLKLQKMEQEGLLSRQPDEADLRQMRCYLTDKGRLLKENMKVIIQKIEHQAIENISFEEITLVEKILTKIKYNLTKETTK